MKKLAEVSQKHMERQEQRYEEQLQLQREQVERQKHQLEIQETNHKAQLEAILQTVGKSQSIKHTLMQNEYPSKFNRQMHLLSLQQEVYPHTKRIQTTVTRSTIFLFLKLPYLGSISYPIKKELHQYTKANIPESKSRYIHTTNKLKKTDSKVNEDLFTSAKLEEIS